MTSIAESATTVQANRALFTDTVERLVLLAQTKLQPELHGRLERAARLVLDGAVWLEENGSAMVRASDGAHWYHTNGSCQCPDVERAPLGMCKHRLARGIQIRAQEQLNQALTVDLNHATLQGAPATVQCTPCQATVYAPHTCPHTPAPVALPEAPASVNVYVEIGGRKVQITLRDTDETRLLTRLTALLAQYPVPEASAQPSMPVPPSEPGQRCLIHGIDMVKQVNRRGSWWSHRTADGWCKGR